MCDKDGLIFPVNLYDWLPSDSGDRRRDAQALRCTLVEYPLPDWYGPFGSLSPSC